MSAESVRVFVGCDPNDCDLEQMMVLEHSMRRRASVPVDLHWMRLSRDPSSFWYSDPDLHRGWRTDRWATPFSGFRWAIPALCGFTGRAIYLDTDMIVLSDIADLWNLPLASGELFAARREPGLQRFCVMLWDCAAAQGVLPSIDELRSQARAHLDLTRYFATHHELIHPLDAAFNNIDGEDLPVEAIKILHYSDMGTQFSHRYSIPRLAAEGVPHWFDGEVLPHPRRDLDDLFGREYAEALKAGRSLAHYRSPSRFGHQPKKSERRYKGNSVTRGWRRWLGAEP